jgi:hypothetical protein
MENLINEIETELFKMDSPKEAYDFLYQASNLINDSRLRYYIMSLLEKYNTNFFNQPITVDTP